MTAVVSEHLIWFLYGFGSCIILLAFFVVVWNMWQNYKTKVARADMFISPEAVRKANIVDEDNTLHSGTINDPLLKR